MASYAGLLELRGPHGHTVRDFPSGKSRVGLLGRRECCREWERSTWFVRKSALSLTTRRRPGGGCGDGATAGDAGVCAHAAAQVQLLGMVLPFHADKRLEER